MTTDDRPAQTATQPLTWWQPGPDRYDVRPPAPAPGGGSHGPAPAPGAGGYGPAEATGGGSYGPPPAAPPAAPERRSGGWLRRIGAGLAVVALSLGSGLAGAELALRDQPAATAAAPVVEGGSSPVTGGSNPTQQLAKVAAAVQPSIVSLSVRGMGGSGSGSGVILRSDGTILTNNHVVEGAAEGGTVRITFADGKTADAEVIGRDPASDLAVVKAQNVSGLKPVTLGSTENLHVGDTVLAVGSPLGLEGSVSAGIVSALHRPVNVGSTTLSDAIQTDAPINPGNSGGGLFDSSGRLVGINSAIATLGGAGGQGGNIGVGFAIPVDAAKTIADQLIRGEQPTHAVLGVQIADAQSGGALLETVTEGGAAADAGLRPGDVITKLGDRRIDDATDLAAAVRSQQPGDEVEVTYVRDGETRTATAILGSAT